MTALLYLMLWGCIWPLMAEFVEERTKLTGFDLFAVTSLLSACVCGALFAVKHIWQAA